MDKALEALVNTIISSGNIAIVVLFSLCIFLAWLVVKARQDEREDRKSLVDALSRNTQAINDLRISIAASTGRTN